MSEPNVNFNIHGNVNQAAAKIENSNSHIGDVNNFAEPPTPDQVFKKLAEAIPEDAQEAMEEQVFEPLRAELQALAAMPIAEAEAAKPTVLERVKTYVAALAPYSEKLNKVALSVGEAALSAIAPPAGWLVSATLAGIKALRE